MKHQLGFEFSDLRGEIDAPGSGLFGVPGRRIGPGRTNERGARKLGQLTLPLDARADVAPEITVRGQVRVETVLRDLVGPRVIVQLTENRSTMISYKRRRGVLYVRAHAIFADAPVEVLRAIASFVSDLRATPREASLIDEWIELNRYRVKRTDKPVTLSPRGEVHDLAGMFAALNAELFEGRIRAGITWSRAARNQKRTSIRMGSYCDETQVIRIHPALDQEFVPDYFVQSVIFHEMLHEHHGVVEGDDGRRCVHTPQFVAHERTFPRFEDARRWEKTNLDRLLRY